MNSATDAGTVPIITADELLQHWQGHRRLTWQWKMPGYEMILYGIDDEIHQRGRGYVYPRALGVEPPALRDCS
jgi:uncharacterized damage-inducible protein DinB